MPEINLLGQQGMESMLGDVNLFLAAADALPRIRKTVPTIAVGGPEFCQRPSRCGLSRVVGGVQRQVGKPELFSDFLSLFFCRFAAATRLFST